MTHKVVMLHNRYQQAGGEDVVFSNETALLTAFGHTVVPFVADNHDVNGMGRMEVAASTMWNRRIAGELRSLFRREAPSVVHCHNTFPLVSPSAYYAARETGVPVVQTLHNYRLLCPGALLFRNGQPCDVCVGKAVPWRGVAHGCYRHDRAASAVVGGMVTLHRALGTWRDLVDVYIALSEFARQQFVRGGLAAERIVVKPNFLTSDPGVGEHRGRYVLYVGRLSDEKGLPTLLDAWRRSSLRTRLALKVVGTGPLVSSEPTDSSVEWMGARTKDEVLALMRDAAFLVVPSVCYENFPMAIVEAFATGLPVMASGHGAMAEIIADEENGRLFRPGDPDDLAAVLEWAVSHPREMAGIGRTARRAFELKYTAESNHEALMAIYERVDRRQAA
jgi:glycosyltransferase involved in cell wall biosynthesis